MHAMCSYCDTEFETPNNHSIVWSKKWNSERVYSAFGGSMVVNGFPTVVVKALPKKRRFFKSRSEVIIHSCSCGKVVS